MYIWVVAAGCVGINISEAAVRSVSRGASVALFSWALTNIVFLPQLSLAASAPATSAQPSLAEDPVYLRQGAITTMETCLTVASDLQAHRLWSGKGDPGDPTAIETSSAGAFVPEDLKRLENLRGLIDWLGGSDNPIRRSGGFGTLLACAHIVGGWRGALPGSTADFEDGRFEHGTVVIDLAYDPTGAATGGSREVIERARIDPVPLVRLLTSRNLLPRAAHGGVVLRNAMITGPLLFNDIDLSLPLNFVNVKFQGGEYRKAVFGVDRPIENRALTIIHSRFEDHFLVSDSQFCGDVGIQDSVFEGSFELREIKHLAPNEEKCDAGDTAASEPPVIRIQTSRFDQDLRIGKSTIKHLFLYSNRIESFSSTDVDFGDHLEIYNNAMGSFYADQAPLARLTSINYNEIGGDFTIYGSMLVNAADQAMRRLQISSNRIGGGLKLLQIPTERLPSEVDLRSNRAGNGSYICAPKDWRGKLQLEGSAFAGVLTIGVAERVSPAKGDSEFDPTLPCRIVQVHDETLDGVLNAASEVWVSGRPADEEYCPPIDGKQTQVDLKAAEVRTLQWHFPLSCKYRWSGYGLLYDLWLPHPKIHEPEGSEGAIAAFRKWRYTLGDYQPAPLDAMSRYLEGKGSYVASRDIRIEAKRLNYAPDCPPDKWWWSCLGLGVKGAWATPADEGAETPETAMDLAEATRRVVALLFLLPAGYGAAPEYALFCIFVGWVLFALAYLAYINHSQRRLQSVKKGIADVLTGIILRGINSSDHELYREVCRVHNLMTELDDLPVDEQCQRLKKIILPDLWRLYKKHRGDLPDVVKFVRYGQNLGTTSIYGFSRFNPVQLPTRFTPWRYSIDAMLPVIDLHAYSSYYPEARWMRFVPVVQHLLGWWWVTVFVASAAIL